MSGKTLEFFVYFYLLIRAIQYTISNMYMVDLKRTLCFLLSIFTSRLRYEVILVCNSSLVS